MITLTATINLLSGSGNITGLSIDKNGNNISGNISNVLGTTMNSRAPFILGSSMLGMGYNYSGNVDYFISKQLSNNSGVFTSPFSIVVNGQNITNLSIVFDTEHKQHPKSISVDGTVYTDDDATFVMTNLSNRDHTIVIDNWSEPNSPLIIQGIYTNITIHLDNRYLINIFRACKNTPDTDKPSFGIISNSGGIKFNDLSLEFGDYIQNDLLTNSVGITMYINNTLNGKKQLIGKYTSHEWKYDNNNFVVQVSFGDNLVNMQKIYLDETTNVVYKNGQLLTFVDIFNLLNKQTLSLFKETIYNKNVDLSAQCNSYKINQGDTLWSIWNDFCQATKCYMYRDPMIDKIVIESF